MKVFLTIFLCLSAAFGQFTQTGNYTITGLSSVGSVSLPSTPHITTTSLPNGQQNVAYSSTLTESGGTGPFCWAISVGSLPTGLSLNGGTISGGNCVSGGSGLISGTPTLTGTSSFTVQLTDSLGQTDTASLNLTIVGTVTITTNNIISATVAIPYSQAFTASGGNLPYTWAMTSGAAALSAIGLNFNTSTATLAGTPTGSGGVFPFTIQVTDSAAHSDTHSYVLTVNSTSGLPLAQLPQTWVNNHECDPPGGVWDVTKTIPGNYPATMAGLNQSANDWAAAGDQWWHVVITAGTVITGALGSGVNSQWTWPAKAVGTGLPSKCLVYESSSPNSAGQTVCSHKTVDNSDGTSPRNLGCNTTGGITDLSNMWSLHSITGNPSGTLCCGAIINMAAPNGNGDGPSHIVVKDMEATTCAGANGLGGCQKTPNQYSLIYLNTSNSVSNPTTQNQPHSIGIERSYIHGDFDDTGISANGEEIVTAVNVGCGDCWFMWNYFDRIADPHSESHIMGLNDAQTGLKLVGNWFEGSSIPTFSGGGTNIVAGVVPADVEYRKNRMTHAPGWLTASACTNGTAIKNSSELKMGIRYLFNGNIFENSYGCAQYGEIFLMAVRASSGKPNNNYNAITKDVTFTNNILRHGGNGIGIGGRSGINGAGFSTSYPGRNWTIMNNVIHDINHAVYAGNLPIPILKMGTAGSLFACSAVRTSNSNVLTCADNGIGFHQHDVTTGDPVEVTNCPDDPTMNTPVAGGVQQLGPFATFADPTSLSVTYPNSGANSTQSLLQGTVNITCGTTCNTAAWVSGTQFSTGWVGNKIMIGAGGNQQLYTITAVASSTSLTLSPAFAAAISNQPYFRGCMLTTHQGSPFNLIFAHNTVVTQEPTLRWPSGGPSSKLDPDYYMGQVIQNNMTVMDPVTGWTGWTDSGAGEGNPSELFTDTNTLLFDHSIYTRPVAVASKYRQYDGHGNAATPNGAVFPAEDPNTTIWFVQNAICPGATVGNSDCPGLAAFMSGATFNANSSHPLTDYALVADSPYKAGGARQASDGTDMGANMSAVSTAETENQYSGCSGNCGSHGPWPD